MNKINKLEYRKKNIKINSQRSYNNSNCNNNKA